MSTALIPVQRKSKAEVRADLTQSALGLADKGLQTFKDVAVAAISSPIVSIVLSTALIEYLQTIKIGTGEYNYVQTPRHTGPGWVWQWGEVRKPLISQPLASTMEGVIISSAALQSVGGLAGLGGLVKAFL